MTLLYSRTRLVSLALLVSVVSIVPPRPAHADDRQAAAQAAFDDGRQLMAAGRFDEACARFEASQLLDPAATGTLVNLATCEEQRGRLATAWAAWVAVRDRSRRDGNHPREDLAIAHIDALAPRLPRLRITVAGAASAIEVQRNDLRVPQAMLAVPFPVDPGPQRIEARARGKRPWRAEMIAVEGRLVDVVVTPVDDAPPIAVEVARPGRGLRLTGFAVGGAGAIAIAVGALFGREARARSDEVSRATAWSAALDRAVIAGHTAERRMQLGYGLGAAALATGAALVYLGYRRERAPRIAITASSHDASLLVAGSF